MKTKPTVLEHEFLQHPQDISETEIDLLNPVDTSLEATQSQRFFCPELMHLKFDFARTENLHQESEILSQKCQCDSNLDEKQSTKSLEPPQDMEQFKATKSTMLPKQHQVFPPSQKFWGGQKKIQGTPRKKFQTGTPWTCQILPRNHMTQAPPVEFWG